MVKSTGTAPIVEVIHRPMQRDAVDLRRLRDCFARNSDRPRSMEALEWLYLHNPAGDRLFVDVAVPEARDTLAAIYASLPGWFVIAGVRQLGLQSLDTLTDAGFRGRGLFVSLAKETYSRAVASGAALVYGFPNGSSAHGFFQKLGWVNLDPVPFLIRPLRVRYAASRWKALAPHARWIPDLAVTPPVVPRLPGTRVVRLDRFDARATTLWEAFRRRGIGVAVDRDAEYLNWRIADKPDETYETLAVERGGELEALCTFCVKDKHGGRIGYVMELLHRSGHFVSASLLLARCVTAMARAGADAVLAWCLEHAPNRRCYQVNGFFTLPSSMRPIELHFGARGFDARVQPIVQDRSRWYISYLDSDTV